MVISKGPLTTKSGGNRPGLGTSCVSNLTAFSADSRQSRGTSQQVFGAPVSLANQGMLNISSESMSHVLRVEREALQDHHTNFAREGDCREPVSREWRDTLAHLILRLQHAGDAQPVKNVSARSTSAELCAALESARERCSSLEEQCARHSTEAQTLEKERWALEELATTCELRASEAGDYAASALSETRLLHNQLLAHPASPSSASQCRHSSPRPCEHRWPGVKDTDPSFGSVNSSSSSQLFEEFADGPSQLTSSKKGRYPDGLELPTKRQPCEKLHSSQTFGCLRQATTKAWAYAEAAEAAADRLEAWAQSRVDEAESFVESSTERAEAVVTRAQAKAGNVERLTEQNAIEAADRLRLLECRCEAAGEAAEDRAHARVSQAEATEARADLEIHRVRLRMESAEAEATVAEERAWARSTAACVAADDATSRAEQRAAGAEAEAEAVVNCSQTRVQAASVSFEKRSETLRLAAARRASDACARAWSVAARDLPNGLGDRMLEMECEFHESSYIGEDSAFAAASLRRARQLHLQVQREADAECFSEDAGNAASLIIAWGVGLAAALDALLRVWSLQVAPLLEEPRCSTSRQYQSYSRSPSLDSSCSSYEDGAEHSADSLSSVNVADPSIVDDMARHPLQALHPEHSAHVSLGEVQRSIALDQSRRQEEVYTLHLQQQLRRRRQREACPISRSHAVAASRKVGPGGREITRRPVASPGPVSLRPTPIKSLSFAGSRRASSCTAITGARAPPPALIAHLASSPGLQAATQRWAPGLAQDAKAILDPSDLRRRRQNSPMRSLHALRPVVACA